MITSRDCLAKYGRPTVEFERKWMTIYNPPAAFSALPKKIYCNRDLVAPLDAALKQIILNSSAFEIKTWDGCFNIRKIRGSETEWSLHSWGVAFDINAATNRLGTIGDISDTIVKIFQANGFDWGGDWKRLDMQHFQLAAI